MKKIFTVVLMLIMLICCGILTGCEGDNGSKTSFDHYLEEHVITEHIIYEDVIYETVITFENSTDYWD